MKKNREIRHLVYNAKRRWGRIATIYRRTSTGTFDYETGTQDVTYDSYELKRVVRLPVKQTVKEFSKFRAELEVGDLQLLIDRRDYVFALHDGDYIELDSKRYDLIRWLDLDGEAYLVLARNVQEEPSP